MTTPPSRLDQIETILMQVAIQQQANTQAINNLSVKIDTLTDDVDVLRDYFLHSIQHAEDDRQAWQAEIHKIWEYLRDRNGGSSPLTA